MKAVLRITLAYFSFLPLQRWANIVGAVLIAMGVVSTLLADDPKEALGAASMFGLPGTFLIVISPISGAGYALRYASTRSMLHLRPRGRLYMLLGTTLAITLVAIVVSLPILASYISIMQMDGHGRIPTAMQPSAWFMVAWMFTAISCLIMFIGSCSRTLTVMTPALIFAVIFIARAAHAPSLHLSTVFMLALCVWAIFATWYWRTAAAIKRPTWMNDRSPLGFGGFVIAPLERLSWGRNSKSAAHRLRVYLLGSTSLPAHAAIGAFPALLMVTLIGLAPNMPDEARRQLAPQNFMFALIFVAGSLGFMMTRRARFLWLKAGLDRDALFRVTERAGLQSALLAFSTGAAVLLVASTPGLQELVPLALNTAIAGAMAVALFYLGLWFIRGWKARDVITALFVYAVAMYTIIRSEPTREPSGLTIWIAAIQSVGMIVLLRLFAARRWRTIDWRVAQLPKMGWMSR